MGSPLKKTVLTLAFIGAAFFAMAAGTRRRRDWSAAIAAAFGPLSETQAGSVDAIVDAFERLGDGDERKLAYILATAWHESRLKPIREIRGKVGTELWAIQERYWPSGYYGRGYAQLTWRDNYAKMSPVVGIDLVASPEAALEPAVAASIIVAGMMGGMFTSKRLSSYIHDGNTDYYNARRVLGAIFVAGTDTAAIIERHTFAIIENLDVSL